MKTSLFIDLLFENFLPKIWIANLLNPALKKIVVIFQINNWIQVKFSRPTHKTPSAETPKNPILVPTASHLHKKVTFCCFNQLVSHLPVFHEQFFFNLN